MENTSVTPPPSLRLAVLGLISIAVTILVAGMLSTFVYSFDIYNGAGYAKDLTSLLIALTECVMVFLIAYGIYLRNKYVYWFTVVALWVFLLLAVVTGVFLLKKISFYWEVYPGILLLSVIYFVSLVFTAVSLSLRRSRETMTDRSVPKSILILGGGVIIVVLFIHSFFGLCFCGAPPQEQIVLPDVHTSPEICQKHFIEGTYLYTVPITCSFALSAEGPIAEFHIATSGELSVYNGTTKIFSSATARDDKGELVGDIDMGFNITDHNFAPSAMSAVLLRDVTYDGYLDIDYAPYVDPYFATLTRSTHFFSFDPQSGKFANLALLSLNLNLDSGDITARTVESYENSSAGLESSEKLYRFENGVYVLAREVVQEFYYRYSHLKSHENDIVRIVRERQGDKLVEIERAYASPDKPGEGLVWVASYDQLPNSYEKGMQRYLADNTSDFERPDYQDYLHKYAATALIDYHRGDGEVDQESNFCEISKNYCFDGISFEFERYGPDIMLIVTNGPMSGAYNPYQGVYKISVARDLLRLSPLRVIDTTTQEVNEAGTTALGANDVSAWWFTESGLSFQGMKPFGLYPCMVESRFEVHKDKLILSSKSLAKGCRLADGTHINIDTPADVPENFDDSIVEIWRADPAAIEKARAL